MKKTLSKYIFGGVFFVLALVLCFTMGVVAGNAKKTMEFNVGVNYDPVFDIVVELLITKSGSTNTYKIFDSEQPNTINQTYIDSITTDTINLKNLSDNTITAASLTIYNYTDKNLLATISGSEYQLNALNGKIENLDIKNGLLGATLVSLKFEELPLVTVTFNAGNSLTETSQVITYGQTVEKPDTPYRENYFLEWCTDSALQNKFDFNNNVETNLQLYPNWVEAKPFVVWDANSTTVTIDASGDDTVNSVDYSYTTIHSGEAVRNSLASGSYKSTPFYQYWSTMTKVVFTERVNNIQFSNAEWFNDNDGGGSSLTTVEFHKDSKLSTIVGGLFANCSKLETINIPSSVTTIDYWALGYCYALKNITIPDSVTTIGRYAFRNCTGLTDITFGDNPKLMTINASAFWYCASLKNIIIPSSVITIVDGAFEGCSNLTIYCEAEEQPSGWSSSWNPSNCPVTWGYKASN